MTGIPLKMGPFERPDPILTSKIVTQLKSQGIFDEFRKECMADVDTKPAYQNLRQRVEGSVAAFLKLNPWRPDMNKNQLRDNLRKHIQSGGFLDIGVDRIVDQVVNPKIYSVFLPKVEELVQNCLGMDKGKPVFDPPPQVQPKPEPSKFQNKHNLAPRAALTASRFPVVPTAKVMKPPEPAEEKLSTTGENSPTSEKATDRSFVMDEEVEEAEEADDDEESPPFEHHSESDRLILGVRTDSSDSNSNENQVVTTIVDDQLEERIDKNEDEKKNNVGETTVKEEEEKDGFTSFTSDDSVPKTPTINMEGSDGTLIEFNSISEYKRYQNKFDEESVDNVEEEVISSRWTDESGYVVKGERIINKEDSGGMAQKRKMNYQHFDEKSSSSFDKSSSCDEGKFNSFTFSTPKKQKIEDDNETLSEHMINDDSNTDKSLDKVDIKQKHSSSELRDKSKRSSSSSKEGKSHHHSHGDRQKKSSSHHRNSSTEKHTQKEHRENLNSNGHSSTEKSLDHCVRDEKHTSKDRSKEKIKAESSSSKLHSGDSKSKSSDRGKEHGIGKKLIDKPDVDDKIVFDKDRKDSKHEHRSRSRDYHNKEKKPQDRHDKHSDVKKDHDPSHKHSSDKRHGSKSSKHSHSSSKHKSSSGKHRSDKDDKHTDSSDKHKSHEKKYEKASKHESKKKQKEYCKTIEKDFEGRRSSDRDSNGPSGRSHFSNSNISKSSTSRNNVETPFYSSDKTTTNSDNTVSDNVDYLQFDSTSEQGIASPDPEITEEQWNESKSVSEESKELCDEDILESDEQSSLVTHHENNLSNSIVKNKNYNTNYDINHGCILLDETKQSVSTKYENFIENDGNNIRKCDTLQNIKESVCDDYTIQEQDIRTPASSVHDTSSEKENIDFAVNYKQSENMSPSVFSNTDDKIVKFKKPKIAANIFEVRKIMQERRHLKRMEKKRLKLLLKTNTQDCPIENPPEVKSENQDVFLGFDDLPTNKIEVYDCLINRLNSEISLMNDFEVHPNLLTSLIKVNPDLDEYIETVLKGKVHRNIRVRVPPICDDFYTYDVEQNAYILIQNPSELVDNNLNNLNPRLTSKDVYSNTNNLSNENVPNVFDQRCSKSRLDISEESTSPKSDSGDQNFILSSLESDDSKSSTRVIRNTASGNSKEDLCDNNNSEKTSSITADEIATLGIKTSNENDVKATTKLAFNLTFNQTYDEILKDREHNAESLSGQSDDNSRNQGTTVMKITNNEVTEQVIMKRVEFNFLNKSEVPKITRTVSIINGNLTKSSSPEQKQVPLISRIKKSNNVVLAPASSVKSQHVNGIASLESSSFEAEVAVPDNITPKTINDVIGIVDSGIDLRSPNEVTCLRQRNTRNGKHEGARQHQRYNSSDLYKPRPQLGTRRSRGQSSPVVAPVPTVITRKRAAGTEIATSTPKRRR